MATMRRPAQHLQQRVSSLTSVARRRRGWRQAPELPGPGAPSRQIDHPHVLTEVFQLPGHGGSANGSAARKTLGLRSETVPGSESQKMEAMRDAADSNARQPTQLPRLQSAEASQVAPSLIQSRWMQQQSCGIQQQQHARAGPWAPPCSVPSRPRRGGPLRRPQLLDDGYRGKLQAPRAHQARAAAAPQLAALRRPVSPAAAVGQLKRQPQRRCCARLASRRHSRLQQASSGCRCG